jgi:HEPN domain-containing protein
VSQVSLAALAAAHLDRARLAREQGDETAAVLWSSLCAQVAITSIAAEHGVETRKDHFQRSSAARRLFDTGVLEEDVGDLLIRLNEERKYAIYDGRPPDLRGRNWEQVFEALGRLVDVAGRTDGDASA